jgi:hypothetical protein
MHAFDAHNELQLGLLKISILTKARRAALRKKVSSIQMTSFKLIFSLTNYLSAAEHNSRGPYLLERSIVSQ